MKTKAHQTHHSHMIDISKNISKKQCLKCSSERAIIDCALCNDYGRLEEEIRHFRYKGTQILC